MCRLQAAILPASLCCTLLVPLDSGMSEHAAIQQEADRLLAACCARFGSLLATDATLAADASVQAPLLQFLGPLQDMLNNQARRDLFRRLPFALLLVLAPPLVLRSAAALPAHTVAAPLQAGAALLLNAASAPSVLCRTASLLTRT
jgi:hypothetical protein